MIATQVTFNDLTAAPLLTVSIIAIAILTKVVGCGGVALACGESRETSLRIGAGMVGRGEVALVVASVGLSTGVVDGAVFSIAVVVTIATTLAAPLLLKLTYRTKRNAPADRSALVPELSTGGR